MFVYLSYRLDMRLLSYRLDMCLLSDSLSLCLTAPFKLDLHFCLTAPFRFDLHCFRLQARPACCGCSVGLGPPPRATRTSPGPRLHATRYASMTVRMLCGIFCCQYVCGWARREPVCVTCPPQELYPYTYISRLGRRASA